jgi:hypothetical protein
VQLQPACLASYRAISARASMELEDSRKVATVRPMLSEIGSANLETATPLTACHAIGEIVAKCVEFRREPRRVVAVKIAGGHGGCGLTADDCYRSYPRTPADSRMQQRPETQLQMTPKP